MSVTEQEEEVEYEEVVAPQVIEPGDSVKVKQVAHLSFKIQTINFFAFFLKLLS